MRLIVVCLLTTACTGVVGVDEPSTTLFPTSTTEVVDQTTSTQLSEVSGCQGESRSRLDDVYESLTRYYNTRDADRLVALVGDGPVSDVSLEPLGSGSYDSVDDWLRAAGRVGDLVTVNGYGPGNPFRLIVERRSPLLEANGIDNLAVTLNFWTDQSCELRVEVTDPISSPDGCRFFIVFDQTVPAQCVGPFQPRALHVAVWTGSLVLVFGGETGTTETAPLTSGLRLDPTKGTWEEIAEAPEGVLAWPGVDALWTGDELHVVGTTTDGQVWEVVVLTYTPASDSWEISPPRPDEYATPGAAVWTGSEVVLAGGDTNAPSNTAWAYDPDRREWRQLDDMPVTAMEGVEAVVVGDVGYFIGGYPDSPAVALDLNTLEWSDIADPELGHIERHVLVGMDGRMALVGGHDGPSQVSMVHIYDLVGDTWTRSSPMPVDPRERTDAVWTGSELIVWGGFGTYAVEPDTDGDYVFGDGAAYDPDTDEWRVLAESPLADRCDHTLTWTGVEMIVVGGLPLCGDPNVLAFGDAALYDPDTDSWRMIPTQED